MVSSVGAGGSHARRARLTAGGGAATTPVAKAGKRGSGLDPDERRSGVSGPLSLTRILRMLEILTEHEHGYSLADICRRLGAPRSSTFALVRPALSLGYLVREAGVYRLGPAAFALASRILGAREADKIVHTVMQELADKTGLTVMFSEFLRDEAAVVHREVIQSRRAIRYVATVGNKRPLLPTAAGRAILAFTDPEWVRGYLDSVGPQANMPPRSAARKRYEAILARARRQGFATSLGDWIAAIGSVAAPILNVDGESLGSVGASGPLADTRADLEHIADEVTMAARTLSQSLGMLGSISTAALEPRERTGHFAQLPPTGGRRASLPQVITRRRT